jgi:hypothetical protein
MVAAAGGAAAPAPPAASRTVWPTVIGVIAIVFACLGLLQGCGAALAPAFMGWMADLMGRSGLPGTESTVAQFEATAQFLVEGVILGVVAIGLAILLLVGGIALVRRRAMAVRACLAWAVLKLAYALPKAWYTYLTSAVQFQAMRESTAGTAGAPPLPAAMYRGFEIMTPLIALGELIFIWALPIFILVWMRRGPIRREMRTW